MRRDRYVLDLEYTAGFYAQTAPTHLAFAALVGGARIAQDRRPARVHELGFGQGFGLALLAAANPDMAFEGCDFNAAHVERAQRFIAQAGLENVVVAHRDFAAAAVQGARDLDVVIAHGVLSWVGAKERQAIAAFLARRLRDDGVCYLSYNAAPGWAPLAPLRDVMRLARERVVGDTPAQLAAGLQWLQEMRRANAAYFVANPVAARHVDRMSTMERAALAHEYFALEARAFSFDEVATFLAPSGLSHLASTALMENFDSYMVPTGIAPLLREIDDAPLRESLRDVAANRFFRQDVFARGATRLGNGDRRAALSKWRFALTLPRDRLSLEFQCPFGPMRGRPDLYHPIADRLAAGPAGFDELAAIPPFVKLGATPLLETLCVLIDSRQLLALPATPGRDPAPAQRFNRMVIEAARTGRVYGHLASPVARAGVAVDDFDLLALAAMRDGAALEPAALAQRGLRLVQNLGRRPTREGATIDSDAEAVEFFIEPMRCAVEEKLPVWRRLGVV